MKSHGLVIDWRHIMLLADLMCVKGTRQNPHGVRRGNIILIIIIIIIIVITTRCLGAQRSAHRGCRVA